MSSSFTSHFGSLYMLPTFMHAGEDVVFIANDWHTALLPCYLKSMYKPKGIYKSARVGTLFACMSFSYNSGQPSFYSKPWISALPHFQVAFCIHNIAYQGRFGFADFRLLSLPDEFKSSFDFIDG
jgi:granule-bound starch synthase